MRDLQNESIDAIADEKARGLSEHATQSAFNLFHTKEFRQHAGFVKLSQAEQDRIFNELVCAYVTLAMLLLDAPDLHSRQEFGGYLEQLKKKIPEALVTLLNEFGVDARFHSDWLRLIEMRYEEYAKDQHEVRKAAMELESADKTLDEKSLTKIQMLAPVQSVAIGCHHHICRGRTKGKDELFKVLLNDLSKFYVILRVSLEGKKITLATKVRAKMTLWLGI